MKVSFLQFHPKLFHEKHNLKKITEMIKNCTTDLMVLPELTTSGYLFLNKAEMEPLSSPLDNGRIANYFKNLAKEKNCAFIVGFLEKYNKYFFNSQMLVTPEGKINVYRKTHLFFEEYKLFKPGDTGFNVFPYKGIKLGLMICFDWIFPESTRILALKGADIICHSANLVLPYCQKAMVTRSIENQIFTITSNRIGKEKHGGKELTFTGMSQITNPKGEIIAQASNNEEIIKTVDINPQEARNKYVTETNDVFKDRRKKMYQILCK